MLENNEKNAILREISIPDDIFYQKYSVLFNNFSIVIFEKEYLLKENFEVDKNLKKNINERKFQSNSKEKYTALTYKKFQEENFKVNFSWNKIKKLLAIEQMNLLTHHENGKYLYLEIEEEIAKEEILVFLNNIKTFLIVEKKYIKEYINHIEKLFLYNLFFRENLLKEIFNLILKHNLEISYVMRFFDKKESTEIIYNYIFSKYMKKLLSYKKNNRDIVVFISIFISNMLELDEKNKNEIIDVLELSDEENEIILNKIEFLEDKEIENE